jgi:large exoprotein involved in heme utilization and adhesion
VIDSDSLDVSSASVIDASTDSFGDGGSIDITSQSIVLQASSEAFTGINAVSGVNPSQLGPGASGDIHIHTGSLEILDGAQVKASTFSLGHAGTISVQADSIRIEGTSGTLASGILAEAGSTSPSANGSTPTAGDISVKTDSLRVANGAKISTSGKSHGEGGNVDIFASTLSLQNAAMIESAGGQLGGRAGTVTITTGSLQIDNGSGVSTASSQDNAGNINISASADIQIANKSTVTVQAGLDGGDITVTAGADIRLNGSTITAKAGRNGGNISLSSPSLIYLVHSPLTANATHGNGGNIVFDPSFVILDESPITAKVSVQGNGGTVTINSDFFFAFNSPFDVTTPSGIPGTVTVTAPNVDLSGSLVVLPSSLLDAQAQLQEQCARRFSGGISSFIGVGRGGMLVEQGGLLPSFELKGTGAKQ